MKQIFRTPAPSVIATNWKQWGRAFHSNDGTFYWHQSGGQGVNKILEPFLISMTNNHCAFCDGTPFGHMSPFTIEHFRPKHLFKKLAFHWHNLFPCCYVCQAASNKAWRTSFNKAVLKPDDSNYQFSKYFVADFASGRIEVNPTSSASDQNRAQVTIDAYDLNAEIKCKLRASVIKQFKDGINENPPKTLDDFSFRFFIEAGL